MASKASCIHSLPQEGTPLVKQCLMTATRSASEILRFSNGADRINLTSEIQRLSMVISKS